MHPEECRLFVDASKTSLTAALFHIENSKPSISIGSSTTMKENYATMKLLLVLIDYYGHNWLICCDSKVVNILIGLLGGDVNYPCFLCEFDRTDKRADHFRISFWLSGNSVEFGFFNMRNEPLVDKNQLFLPPLHIKLGLVTLFIKTLDRNSFGSFGEKL